MHVLIVIPARIGSSRLRQKPLCLLDGEPLVRVVARRALALESGTDIVVASDDPGILAAVAGLGVAQVLTSPEHSSGTERVAEVIERPEYSRFPAVVNLQCDQPFVGEAVVRGALQCLSNGFSVGTTAVPLDPAELDKPDRVKVLVGPDGRAQWFSRSAIPPSGTGGVFQHVGVYAYLREAIQRWVGLPPCAEEHRERLEQMRPLLRGMPIGVTLLEQPAPLAIDTIEDLRRARSIVNETTGEIPIRISA